MSQPQTVCGVYAQPELRDFRTLSYPCLPIDGRSRTRTVVRQSGNGRRRARWQLSSFSSTLSGLRSRIQFFAASLPRAGGLGKRENRKSRWIFTAELLATAYLHRFNRCQLASATLAGRGCQSTPPSRNRSNSRSALSARDSARSPCDGARLSGYRGGSGPQRPPAVV